MYLILKIIPLALSLLISSVSSHSQELKLTVKITGLENTKGNLLFGLYDNGSDFPKKNQAQQGKILPVSKINETYTFSIPKPGKYALAIIHDENRDGELSTNFLGIPKEGFGFSNNAIGTFGPPSFSKASVNVQKDTTIYIKLRYF
jgi:uncharacterized protein (DUF2141 family)